MDITTARERLKEIAAEHFKDNTFTHYINYMLAGDFAVEVAMLLDFTLASLSAAEKELEAVKEHWKETDQRCGELQDLRDKLTAERDTALRGRSDLAAWAAQRFRRAITGLPVRDADELLAALDRASIHPKEGETT